MKGGGDSAAPHKTSVRFEFMDISATVAKHCGVSIFSILEERPDNVIDVVNYLIEKSDITDSKDKNQKPVMRKDDGFWDF